MFVIIRLIVCYSVFLLWFVSSLCGATDKVLIITHAHSRSDMIELQVKTFETFLENDYEYIVFNDAPNQLLEQQIRETCNRLGVRCVRVPQEMHTNNAPGARHIDGLHYSLERVGFDRDGVVLIIDSDMFLIKPLNVKRFIGDNDLVAVKQSRESAKITSLRL